MSNSSNSNLELLFFESCRSLLIIEFPEILTVIEKHSLATESSTEAIETGSFWNGFVGFVTAFTIVMVLGLISIWSCVICNPLVIFTKFKYFKMLSQVLCSAPQNHDAEIFEIGQELIQEWQQLFHKAKLIDSMMIKRALKNQNSQMKNLSYLRRNFSRNSFKIGHSSHSHGGSSSGSSPEAKSIDLSRVVSTDELLAMKKNLMSARTKLKFVPTRDKPTIVTTEELLKLKQTCNVIEETDC
ncbi:uncharacterized protein LOC129772798 [Toxorhynchites rutilus septentrionalis]|uniref:uncharacterized protein LOC129772798 n=1 Tax=Toxorhynchites rutilus septentrionalis TaxID=329112 RepID=UPI002479DC25|nr:uncharacterized protein LOC129772798 [Toxorhynchites rutilus septentrionalis]